MSEGLGRGGREGSRYTDKEPLRLPPLLKAESKMEIMIHSSRYPALMNWRMRRGIVRERERWWWGGIVEVSWPRMMGILGSWKVVGRGGETRGGGSEVRCWR